MVAFVIIEAWFPIKISQRCLHSHFLTKVDCVLAILDYYWLLYHMQFCDLEVLGYKGIALGFFEDDVQVVTTADSSHCVTHKVIDYIRSLIIASMYMHDGIYVLAPVLLLLCHR